MTVMTDVLPEIVHAPAAPVATLDVTVLAGGPGPEREVSLQSGWAIYEALSRLGYRAELCDIHPNDLSALHRPADIVFIALHGAFGEDGTLQEELDRRGIPYTGSGALASRRAMDKADAKQCFERARVPTPPYEVLHAGNLDERAARIRTPAVVKPVDSGSSVDISIVRTPAVLKKAAADLVERYGQVLVEQFVRGPELTVGVLADEALPVCEIRTRREFYDYQAKYVDDDTQYLFEPDLPDSFLRHVQDVALAAHRALGCRVFSRVDVMVDADRQQPFVLEVNTIPGFTSHSLLPKAAARMGIGFDDLCQRIVELSLPGAS